MTREGGTEGKITFAVPISERDEFTLVGKPCLRLLFSLTSCKDLFCLPKEITCIIACLSFNSK